MVNYRSIARQAEGPFVGARRAMRYTAALSVQCLLPASLAMQQLILDLVAPPAPTLAGFVPGENAELLAALSELAAGRSTERFFYVWGDRGAGKSHLLRALAGGAGMYLNAVPDLRIDPMLATPPLLAMDNVEQLGPSGAIDLFNVYNRMQDAGGVLLASGPCPPAQLELRPDLVTRLAWGLVFQVHALTDGEKIAALQSHAAARGFTLSLEVGQYLLTHWRRDMASLFAALDALDRYSLETKRPITLPLLKKAIERSVYPSHPREDGDPSVFDPMGFPPSRE